MYPDDHVQVGGYVHRRLVDEMDDLRVRCHLPSRVWLLRYLLARALADDEIMRELHELDLAEEGLVDMPQALSRAALPGAFLEQSSDVGCGWATRWEDR